MHYLSALAAFILVLRSQVGARTVQVASRVYPSFVCVTNLLFFSGGIGHRLWLWPELAESFGRGPDRHQFHVRARSPRFKNIKILSRRLSASGARRSRSRRSTTRARRSPAASTRGGRRLPPARAHKASCSRSRLLHVRASDDLPRPLISVLIQLQPQPCTSLTASKTPASRDLYCA